MIRTIAVAAAIAAALTTATPAEAAGRSHRTDLVLDYQAEAGFAVAVKLSCRPARSAAHPNPGKACRTLKRAGGLPANIKAADTLCMLIYAPVTAEITGTWRGLPISWRQTYGNKCEMTRATGVLFTF
jgi:hypothetical protein